MPCGPDMVNIQEYNGWPRTYKPLGNEWQYLFVKEVQCGQPNATYFRRTPSFVARTCIGRDEMLLAIAAKGPQRRKSHVHIRSTILKGKAFER